MREELLRIVAGLQSTRDRMINALTPRFGEAFDGDFDVMLEAINALKKVAAQRALAEKAGPAGEPAATVCLTHGLYGHDSFLELQVQVKPGTQIPVGTKLYAAAPPSHPVEQMDTNKSCLPDGWVAVPMEPTLEMLRAEDAAIPSRDEDDDAFAWGRVGWAAMLKAAPEVPRG